MKKGSALSKTQVNSPSKQTEKKSDQAAGGLSKEYNFDELLADYKSGMDSMKLGNDSSFFTSARRGAGNTTVNSPKLKSFKDDGEGLTFLDPTADYSKQGELHM